MMAEQESGFISSELPGYGDEMEVDLVEHTPPFGSMQCTESQSDLKYALSTMRPTARLSLYDKSFEAHNNPSKPTSLLESVSSSLKVYEVKEPIGCAVVLGRDCNDLPSVRKDVDIINGLLSEGGWDVIYKNCELKHRTLVNLLEDLEKGNHLGRQERDLDEYSMFMLYYSGHGNAEGVVLNDNQLFSYKEIVTQVSKVPCLHKRPKIFIFDSCREHGKTGHQPNTHAKQKNPFHEDISMVHEQQSSSIYGYPPPHTLICFSAAEGRGSYMGNEGSYYTLVLSHALRQFGRNHSFLEVITQVNGGTRLVAEEQQKTQNPIFRSNLEMQLVLNSNFDVEKDMPMDAHTITPMDTHTTTPIVEETLSQYGKKDVLVISKGISQEESQEESKESRGQSLQEKDVIPRDTKARPQWTSREQVMQNTRFLGNGVSVFFLYAPNPDDPYKPVLAEDKWELRNRFLMSRLFFDLELHGFHVLSDLHLGNTEPSNWVQWYITRITHCNYVVMVCSPAFKQLFEESPNIADIPNPKAKRLVCYRDALYAAISNVLSDEGRRKFIPVILEEKYEPMDCVPLLFQAGTVHRVLKEDRRDFDFNNTIRDFEKLVCHMAGIDRVELRRCGHGQVSKIPTLPGPYENLWNDEVEFPTKPPKGYHVGPVPVSQGLVGSSRSSNNGGSYGGHSHSMMEAMSRTSHPSCHIKPSPSILSQPPPLPSQSPPSRHLATPPLADHNTLPLTTPNSSLYLWLSQTVSKWKFVARHLGLEEYELERIVEDHRAGGVDEQCLQMFRKWEQRFAGSTCNYRTLGQVLRDSERNKHLYAEYVQRVKRIENLS